MPHDYLPLLREKLLSLPGAVEDHPWGDTVFKVGGKIFVGAGSSNITVKTSLDHQQALILDPAITVAAYVGRHGWVSIELNDKTIDMALELAADSYASVVATLPKSKRPATV
jgi:predicted DNA-binding protein (MmcQ/YjbR family)